MHFKYQRPGFDPGLFVHWIKYSNSTVINRQLGSLLDCLSWMSLGLDKGFLWKSDLGFGVRRLGRFVRPFGRSM